MKKIILSSAIALAVGLTFGSVAMAQITPETPTQVIPPGPETGQELVSLLRIITNWIFVLFLIVAVIFIILAAFQFLTGGGDPAAIAQARTKLIYAGVGIAVAIASRGLVAVVTNIVGTG
ncbi:hypothetical protein IID24_02935 [Patescibacteria group bacterium]|nr:hypothetical protein [Patescibacteria group bacterium]